MINSFTELDVYQRAYRSALVVAREIIPCLKQNKEYNLADQLGRCTKAIPALIGEGHAKRHQAKHFQKYLNDASGESNEAIVHLSFCRDLEFTKKEIYLTLISEYTIICKQLYNLSRAWSALKQNQPPTPNFQSNH